MRDSASVRLTIGKKTTSEHSSVEFKMGDSKGAVTGGTLMGEKGRRCL